ncbi:hypothetical protein [Microcoleus sp. B4-D4]
MGHGEWGMGNGALGMGHWEWGILSAREVEGWECGKQGIYSLPGSAW